MTEVCPVCGSGFDDPGFKEYQDKNSGSPAVCRDCTEMVKSNPHIQSAFDAIEEALSPENAAIWADGDFQDKLFFFLKMHNEGKITPGDTYEKSPADFGSLGTLQMVQAYLSKLEYDEDIHPDNQM